MKGKKERINTEQLMSNIEEVLRYLSVQFHLHSVGHWLTGQVISEMLGFSFITSSQE